MRSYGSASAQVCIWFLVKENDEDGVDVLFGLFIYSMRLTKIYGADVMKL